MLYTRSYVRLQEKLENSSMQITACFPLTPDKCAYISCRNTFLQSKKLAGHSSSLNSRNKSLKIKTFNTLTEQHRINIASK